MKVEARLETEQVARLRDLKSHRDSERVSQALKALGECADSSQNLMEPVIAAVECYCTVGEISDVLREKWGEYQAND